MYYNDDNTYRGLSSMLEIPTSSIYDTVTKSRVELVKRFKTDIKNINNKLIYYYSI